MSDIINKYINKGDTNPTADSRERASAANKRRGGSRRHCRPQAPQWGQLSSFEVGNHCAASMAAELPLPRCTWSSE